MLIKNREIEKLSMDIRRSIDGKTIDFRDNREGAWGALKNDIHTLANIKNSQADTLRVERDEMSDNLANISHQLKTPITSMLLMADLLERAPEHKQAEFIENLKSGLLHMEWLVSSLLKIAKLDAGAISFRVEKVNTIELVNLAIEPIQVILEKKQQIVKHTSEIEFKCDRRWTVEALTNLIKNASEHSPYGGVINIASCTTPVSEWISVTDSGDGIAKNKIPLLFKRFDGSHDDRGYGIGLPLALAIMQGQNGDIEIQCGGHGKGATFTMKFFK